MWTAIVSFLGGPVVSGLLKAYQAKLAAGNTSERTAVDLAAGEIAAETAETRAITDLKIAEVGHPWEPEKLAFYVVLFYMAKVMIWDAALHLGTTDAVKGEVGAWAALVVAFYFGKRTLTGLTGIIARILKR